MADDTAPSQLSRRGLLGASASVAAAPLAMAAPATPPPSPPSSPPADPRRPVDVMLRVNGREHHLAIDVRTTLLDAVRTHTA